MFHGLNFVYFLLFWLITSFFFPFSFLFGPFFSSSSFFLSIFLSFFPFFHIPSFFHSFRLTLAWTRNLWMLDEGNGIDHLELNLFLGFFSARVTTLFCRKGSWSKLTPSRWSRTTKNPDVGTRPVLLVHSLVRLIVCLQSSLIWSPALLNLLPRSVVLIFVLAHSLTLKLVGMIRCLATRCSEP